jgi:hypothetical protein
MGCLGVHFALVEKDARRLARARDYDALNDMICEIEERWDKKWLQETDKAWDAIHRCLTDGDLDVGFTPLGRVIYADRNLFRGDDMFVSLLTPKRVAASAAAMADIDKKWMRERYFAIDPRAYDAVLDDDDFEYTWGWFVPLRAFFKKAAKAERWVTFTVSY